jgi:hypothetical protein
MRFDYGLRHFKRSDMHRAKIRAATAAHTAAKPAIDIRVIEIEQLVFMPALQTRSLCGARVVT